MPPNLPNRFSSAARNLRNATVYLSIMGHEHERGTILHTIQRKHGELQRLINRDCSLKYTPRLEFRIDDSVAKGDHVLDVLSHLEIQVEVTPVSSENSEQ